MTNFEDAAVAVIDLAHRTAAKGWLPATSGNLSVRVGESPLTFAITRSGADKTKLVREDILLVDSKMEVLIGKHAKPSAETTVHTGLYQRLGVSCILHVHTVENNVISDVHGDTHGLWLSNHELLKALGHWEPDAQIWLPIVENWSDLETLGKAVTDAATADVPGVLVRNHGIYAYGDTPAAALRHLEAFEFLFRYLITVRAYFASLPDSVSKL